METRKQIALEPTIEAGGILVTPLALTVVRSPGKGDWPFCVLVKEAIGVIIRRGDFVRVLMADGRELTPRELVAEYPQLAGRLPNATEGG